MPAFLSQLEFIQEAMIEELMREGSAINELYNRTSSTWAAQPRFMKKIEINPKSASVTVWAKDRIYWFVHEGVRHMRAVLGPYVPKTQPRVLSSGAGSGGRIYASRSQDRPLYEPRKFTETIIERRKPRFRQRMERAILNGVRSRVGF